MGDVPGAKIFGLDSDSYFHAGCSDIVHGCFQSEQVANVDWLYEIHSVDADGHNILSGMS